MYYHDTLLLADAFENIRNKCIEICEPDPTHFLSALGLAWPACFFKKTKIELKLLTDIDLLLMLVKEISEQKKQRSIIYYVFRFK